MFQVVDENENVLLELPIESGRVDITASREGGYISANGYQFGTEQDQFNHVKVVVTLGEVAADRTVTVPTSVVTEPPAELPEEEPEA